MSESNACNVEARIERNSQITVARRCMELFLNEMKLCNERGCTDEERLSVAKKYLASLDQCASSPVWFKVKQIIRSCINGQCRSIDSYIEKQIGEKVCNTEWICSVCGRRNQEMKKKFSQCVTCGRTKCFVLKKLSTGLNECGVHPTAHLTSASKDEIHAAKSFEYHREKWIGDDGKRLIFISDQCDYESVERMGIRSEINNVINSIRQSLDVED
jgi:hypothetical protein